jgi:superfamily II DNA/RNA helicase
MLPKDRQTLFFSATMPQEITKLADQMLRDPSKVSVTPQATTAERVNQRVILIDKSAKNDLLAELLKSEKSDRVLVFTRTKHGADKVVRMLEKTGHRAEAIHGNKSQNNRDRTLKAFRDGSLRTLIATDIAARGIDVDGVSHVINYDLPNVPESYVHRIGRTARAGAEGVAISFCDHEEAAYLRDIERLIRMTIPSENRRTGKQPPQIAAPHQHKKHGNKQDARERAFGGGHKHRNNNNKRHRGQHENRNGGGQRPHHAASNGQPKAAHSGAHNGAPAGAPKGEPTSMENVTFMREPRRQAGHRAPR